MAQMKPFASTARETWDEVDKLIAENPELKGQRQELFDEAQSIQKTRNAEAQAMILQITHALSEASKQPHRDACIAEIRGRFVEDEEFVTLSPYIEQQMNNGDLNWIPAIIRSSARRAMRRNGELIEERRKAAMEAKLREAREKAALEAAEFEVAQSQPGFGLF